MLLLVCLAMVRFWCKDSDALIDEEFAVCNLSDDAVCLVSVKKPQCGGCNNICVCFEQRFYVSGVSEDIGVRLWYRFECVVLRRGCTTACRGCSIDCSTQRGLGLDWISPAWHAWVPCVLV